MDYKTVSITVENRNEVNGSIEQEATDIEVLVPERHVAFLTTDATKKTITINGVRYIKE